MRYLVLLLLLSTGCTALHRAHYGYDRIISIDATEPGVKVYFRQQNQYVYHGYYKLQLMGTTPFQLQTIGEGTVEVWAVKDDMLAKTKLTWEGENQTINFALAAKMTRDDRCCVEGKVHVGMPESMARIAWGDPETIHSTTTAYGRHEQWCYSWGNYIYVEEGRVTSIQN
jgi:hypothetical protein